MPTPPPHQDPHAPTGAAAVAAGEAADLPREIVVPRGIVKWSKWRQATLRAEHREARQQLRAPAAHPPVLAGAPAPPLAPGGRMTDLK